MRYSAFDPLDGMLSYDLMGVAVAKMKCLLSDIKERKPCGRYDFYLAHIRTKVLNKMLKDAGVSDELTRELKIRRRTALNRFYGRVSRARARAARGDDDDSSWYDEDSMHDGSE